MKQRLLGEALGRTSRQRRALYHRRQLFTSSTSFANPAITIARSLSDTFAGIAPADIPGFILAQLAGAL